MSVHLVPAGIESYSQSKLLYVANRPFSLEEKTTFTPGIYKWETRDKIFTLCSEHILPPRNFHSVVPILGADFYKQIGIEIVLANPIHGTFSAEAYAARGIDRIVDSGGFQLLSGVTDYVDPDSVVKNYNGIATIGMPLDLPVKAVLEGYFFDSISHLIKANDEYLLSKLDKGIDLALISHGSTIEFRKRRLDVIDREANVVAIAGLGTKPTDGIDQTYSAVENLLYVTSRYRKKARYFHALGVTTNKMFFIYSLLSTTGYVKAIGADSVTYRLSAVTGLYSTSDFQNFNLDKSLKYKVPLSCPCPVCSVVEDSRIMNNAFLLESHSLWAKQQQVRYVEYLAQGFLAGSISVEDVMRRLGIKKAAEVQFKTSVRYVLDCVAAGKFLPLPIKGSAKINLFHGSSSAFQGKNKKPIDQEGYNRYLGIIRNYEKFHDKKIYCGT